MSKFDMSEYVDVAERERLLFARYPDARIQVDLTDVRDGSGELVGWKAKATVWRTPDDPLPVCDWAVEPVPGRTSFTKDSEAMNASTSAVGRAIVLAGFETKKIASADEVRNRSSAGEPAATGSANGGDEARHGPESPASTFVAPVLRGGDEELKVHFGKNAGKALGSLTEKSLAWYAESWEIDDSRAIDADYALKAAALRLVGKPTGVVAGTGFYADDPEIPF
jgi:hypothetical protein